MAHFLTIPDNASPPWPDSHRHPLPQRRRRGLLLLAGHPHRRLLQHLRELPAGDDDCDDKDDEDGNYNDDDDDENNDNDDDYDDISLQDAVLARPGVVVAPSCRAVPALATFVTVLVIVVVTNMAVPLVNWTRK